MTSGLLVHIAGGSIALVSGALALSVAKGRALHRISGNVYIASMVLMAVTGAYIAYTRDVNITVLAGALSLYLVLTSWFTIRPRKGVLRFAERASFALGLAVSAFGLHLSWLAFNGVTDSLGEFSLPAFVYYFFTVVALLANVGDIKEYFGKRGEGKYKISRHLWRMCVPLYIATSSFFSGQEEIFPEFIQGTFYLSLPQLIVIFALIFWLAKVHFSNPRFRNSKLE